MHVRKLGITRSGAYRIGAQRRAAVAGYEKQLLAQAQQSLNTLQAAQRHAHYRQLRSALSQGQALDKRWLSDSKLALAAEQLLVRLEVTANIDSPSSDASLRMQEQVTMLDEKHQGVAYSLDDLLIAWLNAVGVNEQHQCLGEQQQLNRIVSVLEAVESMKKFLIVAVWLLSLAGVRRTPLCRFIRSVQRMEQSLQSNSERLQGEVELMGMPMRMQVNDVGVDIGPKQHPDSVQLSVDNTVFVQALALCSCAVR